MEGTDIEQGTVDEGMEDLGGEDRRGLFNEKPISGTEPDEPESSEVEPAPSQPSDTGEEEPKEDGEAAEKEPEEEPAEEKDDLVSKLEEHKGNLEKALAQERAKNRSLQLKLRQQARPPAKPAEGKIDGLINPEFKPLSTKEFQDLRNDDPEAALDYMHDLKVYDEYQEREARRQDEAQAEMDRVEAVVLDGRQMIADAVPGVYDDNETGQGIRAALTNFGIEQGFESHELAFLSDPGTMILPAGADQPIPLGSAAASFVKFAHKMSQTPNIDHLREEIRKEVEDEIRPILVKEITSKFKGEPPEKGLGDLPSSQSSAPTKWRILTEKETAKLTPAQRDAYLNGDPI